MKHLIIFCLLPLFFVIACHQDKKETSGVQDKTSNLPEKEDFDTTLDGKKVSLHHLINQKGMIVQITNYGARIVSIVVPDKTGDFNDVALGVNTIGKYLQDDMSMGNIVGRYANRIEGGEFTLNGEKYQLFQNDGTNALHGGKENFGKKVWQVRSSTDSTVSLQYVSPHMEENFPGKLTVDVKYTLTDKNELMIDYLATTDQATVINLTNHCYFNLKGEGDSTILDHQLKILADHSTPINANLIPTGEIAPVEGTPFDFAELTSIGKRINNDHPQLNYGNGYDHNFVLNKEPGELAKAAELYEPETGRLLELHTTEPGMQLYTGNFMDGSIVGKSGEPYVYRSGIALETQHFPNSPNQPEFPSTVLKPGDEYTQKTIYQFSVKE